MLNSCDGVVENDGKMMWRKEVMKRINMLNSEPTRPRVAFWLDTASVSDARADRARVEPVHAERKR